MRTKRAKGESDRPYSILRKGGRVTFPPDFTDLKLGQRVFFHVDERGVVMATRPKRSHRGRLLSSRVRRGIRSLVSYGPRAGHRG